MSEYNLPSTFPKTGERPSSSILPRVWQLPFPLSKNPTPIANRIPQIKLAIPSHISVALDNLRSAYNVGAIFRTADAVGINHIHLYGITPTPRKTPKYKKPPSAQNLPFPGRTTKTALTISKHIKNRIPDRAVEGGQTASQFLTCPPCKPTAPSSLSSAANMPALTRPSFALQTRQFSSP